MSDSPNFREPDSEPNGAIGLSGFLFDMIVNSAPRAQFAVSVEHGPPGSALPADYPPTKLVEAVADALDSVVNENLMERHEFRVEQALAAIAAYDEWCEEWVKAR